MKERLQEALRLVERSLSEGQEAFRARRDYKEADPVPSFTIPPSEGEPQPLPAEEMTAPAPEKTLPGGGRINPPGISFLYLAFDSDTAVAEVRPPKGDLVTVARFQTVRDLRVADLTRIEPLDTPFGHEDLVREVEKRLLLRQLDREFAEPVNPDKGAIDYVPTQYAGEVIREAGFDGIVYKSALGKANNLVLFDPATAKVVESPELVAVRDVHYKIGPASWRNRGRT